MRRALLLVVVMSGCGGCAGWTEASHEFVVDAAREGCAIKGGEFSSFGKWYRCNNVPETTYEELEGTRD